MAMIPKTMDDVFSYTQVFHEQLAQHLDNSAAHNHAEREQLLLTYLAEHERRLGQTLSIFKEKTGLGPLNTWFYEYTDRHKIALLDPASVNFSQKNCDDITVQIIDLHEQLIDLYEHLHQRAESDSAKEVLGQLLSIETDKAKLMSYDAGRAQEM